MMLRARFVPSCLLALTFALTACGSGDSGPKPADAGAPAVPSGPVVGGKLGAAIASAAAAGTAAPKAKSTSGDEPPENGIFTPEEAEKRQPKDAAPKLDVLGDGAEPRTALALKLDGSEQKTTLTIGMRMGQGMRLPTVEFALSIKPEKATGDPPKEGAPPAPTRVAATVTGTSLPGSQPLPKELTESIAKLKGMVVRWDLSADGVWRNSAVELPKDAGAGLELVIDALVDMLSALTAPLPSKPVGKDAYWIVSDRARAAVGLDVLRYRVFRVQAIEGDRVTLSVEIRQYAADAKLKLDGGAGEKADMPMEQFDSSGKGTIVWTAGTYLPAGGEISEAVRARVAAGGNRAAMVQTELSGRLGGAAAAPAASATKP